MSLVSAMRQERDCCDRGPARPVRYRSRHGPWKAAAAPPAPPIVPAPWPPAHRWSHVLRATTCRHRRPVTTRTTRYGWIVPITRPWSRTSSASRRCCWNSGGSLTRWGGLILVSCVFFGIIDWISTVKLIT